MITIGLAKPSESAQALIGFFFMFLLAMVIIGGNLEYETGTNITTAITYNPDSTIDSTDQVVRYNYVGFSDTISHRLGYFLAVASAVGMAGVLFALKNTSWGRKEDE